LAKTIEATDESGCVTNTTGRPGAVEGSFPGDAVGPWFLSGKKKKSPFSLA